MMGGYNHSYNHLEKIFFLKGPIDQSQYQATKKCPSCRYQFSDRNEMVFCTFCGYSNDEKCVQRTKYYPQAAQDPATGKPSMRGKICRLCTHKFFVREKVSEVVQQINATKVSMVVGLQNLERDGSDAKNQFH